MTRRLLLSYLALALLVLAGLEIPLGYIYARGETARPSQNIERDAAMLAEITEENIEKGQLGELPDVAGDYAERTGGRVVVSDKQGIVLADTDPAGRTGVSLAAEADIARALRNQPTVTTATDSNGTDVLTATMPGSSGTTIRGALRLTFPLDEVAVRVHRIWGALALAGACVLAAVALVAFSMARWITRPLRTLEAATTQPADGHLTHPPDATTGPPELRSLAASFTRTANRLQQLLKNQQAFASEASHQLKPPLTALRLRLENFEPYLDPRAHHSLEEAVGEVERLGRMVQGLLTLARLENTATTPEPVDLDAALADRVAMWEPLAAEQYVAIDITGPPAGQVWAMPGALEQIIDNRLANALRVSPPHTTITLNRIPGGELHIVDQGPGMSAADRERAFDSFWRAFDTHHDGTGLGLPIVRHLVDASGGTITLNPAPAASTSPYGCARQPASDHTAAGHLDQHRHRLERDDRPGPELGPGCRDMQHVGPGCPGDRQGQPMPVTCRAVVQVALMALRAVDRVMVPAQTAFFNGAVGAAVAECMGDRRRGDAALGGAQGGRAALGGSVCWLERELARGSLAHGWADESQGWTLNRIRLLIARLFHVGSTVLGVWKLMRRHSWSAQVPVRRAIERDEESIEVRKKVVWSQIKGRRSTWASTSASRTRPGRG
ncbi:ATP-binding protein [Streptomyces sp. NPDC001123]